MNESNLIQLKIIVERAVRPVRASASLQRAMREEMLAHVSGVFGEEFAQLGDEGAALERTALRFGNAAEVTTQLQDSVPLSDGIWRFWEGRPEESTLRGALRVAWVTGALFLVTSLVVLFATEFVSASLRDELIASLSALQSCPCGCSVSRWSRNGWSLHSMGPRRYWAGPMLP